MAIFDDKDRHIIIINVFIINDVGQKSVVANFGKMLVLELLLTGIEFYVCGYQKNLAS